MSIKITIPNSSSDVLTFGSGNTPTAAQIAGIDSGSSNGQLALYTTASGTSTERVRVDASGNVGIGTATPSNSAKLDVAGSIISTAATISTFNANNSGFDFIAASKIGRFFATSTDTTGGVMTFTTGQNGSYTERMRIDSSGNLLVGTTSVIQAGAICNKYDGQTRNGIMLQTTFASAGTGFIRFLNSSETKQGEISANTTTTVAYGTSSDYRLKNTIAPMTGALAKVSLLKPCTYKWNADGSDGQGFIAHELQEVCPDAVIGEKDAVNEDGSIDPQGIDTSFLVATLTAAIQELKALVDTQASTITSLTDRITLLENK